MSDYLSNIAAKALNLTPAIEPRPVSLFEPPSGLGSSFDSLSVDRGVDAALDTAALPSDTAADPRPLQGRHVARPLAYDRDRPADTITPVAAPTASLGRMPGARPTPRTAVSATGSSAAEPPAGALASARAFDMTPVATGPVSGHTPGPPLQERRAPLVAYPAPPTVGAVEPDVPFEPAPSSTPSALSSLRGDVSAARVLPLDTEERRSARAYPSTGKIVAQALVTPAGESATHASGEPTMAQAPQPTIRVSIGRVEVRAIIPAAPAAPRPKSVRPHVKPSLADYLKSSRGGR